jgi:two-component system, OmpR family, heavy metal sensor histidine kinase CusS
VRLQSIRLRAISRSLTLRLALLYGLSTSLILLLVAIYMLRVIDQHFIELDVVEMRGKLELASHLVKNARDTGRLAQLPARLDDALLGHHHLALALFEGGQPRYTFGAGDYPSALLSAATAELDDTPLQQWPSHHGETRGLALRLPAAANYPESIVAVAVDTQHHRAFIDQFKWVLAVLLGLASLLALALGWLVARAGLRPLQQTADLARQITAERLHTRLPAEQVPSELEDLASSFNAMLDRLRDSIERLSSFAADLAHEMRTPVSNLMMQTQVMLSQTRSADEYREVLASNLEEYERLARTVADMLFLAKADNGLIVPRRERVDLQHEAAELFEFYEALADDKRLSLQQLGAGAVEGDQLMLRRALSNLLSNAIRYAPPGSVIKLSIAAADASVCVRLENACQDMSAKDLERLFERFYRADLARRETGDGAGLGLAITRSIARVHGGDVRASSTGAQICFELRLPAMLG